MGLKETFIAALVALVVAVSTLHASSAVSGSGIATPARWCGTVSGDLGFGDSGQEVRTLQDALMQEGFYDGGDAYGYYGAHTASAVSGFQQKYSYEVLHQRGLDYGTGRMDRETAAKLKSLHSCPANKPPVIYGLSGPTSLGIGETGTWSIRASDPEGGQLSYYVSWGDGGWPRQLSGANDAGSPVQATSFTHSYASAGTYSITFTVRDAQGLSATSTTTISVAGTAASNGSAKITVIDGNAACPAIECLGNGCGQRCGVMYNATVSLYKADSRYDGGETTVKNADGVPWPADKYVGTEDTSSGAAVFSSLEPGSYMAIANSEGYRSTTVWITVEGGQRSYSSAYLYRWPARHYEALDIASVAAVPAYVAQAIAGIVG